MPRMEKHKITLYDKVMQAIYDYVALTRKDCTPGHIASKIKRDELDKMIRPHLPTYSAEEIFREPKPHPSQEE